MAELSIRRNQELSTPQFQKLSKAEKKAAASRVQTQRLLSAGGQKTDSVSKTLQKLLSRMDQAGSYAKEGRRTLRSGEAALAEVEDNLERMEELARQSADKGAVNRLALQSELEQLKDEVDRIAKDGEKAGLFQEGEDGGELDAVVDAVMDGLAAKGDGVQGLPAWLLKGLTGDAPSRAELMEALGLEGTVSSSELMAALSKLPLDGNSASGYLAALYLGSLISTGTSIGPADAALAAEGLKQLLDMISDGIPADEALELLTSGVFSGLEDFQAQFMGGTAPGLDTFLMDLLFSQDAGDYLANIMDLLAAQAGDMGALMDLMAMLDGSAGLMALLDGLGSSSPEGMAQQQMETEEMGTLQVSGQDLSETEFNPESNTLTVSGSQDVILRGQEGQEPPELILTGGGTVTMQQVNSPGLMAESAQVRVVSAGENVLTQVQLADGTTLTLEGGGLTRMGELRGWISSVLRITGGTLALGSGSAENMAGAIVLDGPAALLAEKSLNVQNAQGEPLTPFDIVWKMVLPEWSEITSLMLDGKQGQLILKQGDVEDSVRLWLLKQDSDEKRPVHTIAFRGRDRVGHPRTQYIYVRWDEKEGEFQEVSMYPNPFQVTGGEEDVDWSYEEETQTLRILTRQVTAVSGGTGVDGNEFSFSGRIVLADGIGAAELTLDGVRCKVQAGRAFDLGRGNDVTLLLQRGTENFFESGRGCAGISMGDGTTLHIDQTKGGPGEPDGVLTANGGAGGAGIGRDSGAGQERTGTIIIRGGVITATATGGGAGIGGALGGPVGDIRILGGRLTAMASCSAAAIGAGIQGPCGDIAIGGAAHVVKAQGGGPDGDIGGCLFGNCGKVQVAAGTDIGGAKLWTQKGLSLPIGNESSLTMPKFRISAKSLGLEELDITTREAAKSAMQVITSDRRWVTRLQGAYGAMYGQLAQSFGGMYNVHQYFSVVRDNNEASSLVMDIREVLRLSPRAKFLAQRGMEDVTYLLR